VGTGDAIRDLSFFAVACPGSARFRNQTAAASRAGGEKAPAFALPSAEGKTVRLSDFSGHNVLIDFYRGYW